MTKSTAGLPLSVALQIPTHWTPEQAFAVFQLVDELREAISQRYALQIQDQYRDHVRPAPANLAQQDPSDPPF